MDEELRKKVEEKLGEKFNYFDIAKFFSQEEIAVINELIKEGAYEVVDENGSIFLKKKRKEEINIEEMRNKTIKEMIEQVIQRKEMTISEIATSLILASNSGIKREERETIYRNVWLGLPIKNIKTYTIGGENFYEFEIDGEILKTNQVLSESVFRKFVFEKFGILLPKPSPETFRLFLMYFKANAQKIEKLKEVENLEEVIRETVINYINNSFVTKNIEETFNYNYVYVEDDKILVPSEILEKILSSRNIKISFQKLAFLLRDLLIGSSKTVRVKGEVKRFWVFNKALFEVKEEVKEEEENENSN